MNGPQTDETDEIRMTWLRRAHEDARQEFSQIASRVRRSRAVRWWKRRVAWKIEGCLLAWTEAAEPTERADLRFLAEDDDGDWLVPRGSRDGQPYWRGYWRWWRPDHWPVYVRSRRARTYVMVERLPEW